MCFHSVLGQGSNSCAHHTSFEICRSLLGLGDGAPLSVRLTHAHQINNSVSTFINRSLLGLDEGAPPSERLRALQFGHSGLQEDPIQGWY